MSMTIDEETGFVDDDVIEVTEVVDDGTDHHGTMPDAPAAIVPVDTTAVDLSVMPGADEFRALAMQAKMLAGSSLVPSALRGKPHDVLLVLMTGRDLGIAPTAALRKCYVVEGQVTIAPALKLALVKIKGLGAIRPALGNNADHATAIAYDMAGQEIHRYTLTWADVENVTYDKAGRLKLITKDNWKNYPARMLWWRCAGWLVDDIWPEVAFGLYTPDEIGAVTDEHGKAIDVREVAVVEGFETRRGGGGGKSNADEAITEETAEALRVRANGLPGGAIAVFKAQMIEREIGGFPSLLRQRKLAAVTAMLGALERRAAGGEWGEWTAPDLVVPPEGVDGDTGEVDTSTADDGETASGEVRPTAADVDDTWDAARLATLDTDELLLVDPALLIKGCAEWDVSLGGVDITDMFALVGVFEAAAEAAF